jgi:hypothetical protein
LDRREAEDALVDVAPSLLVVPRAISTGRAVLAILTTQVPRLHQIISLLSRAFNRSDVLLLVHEISSDRFLNLNAALVRLRAIDYHGASGEFVRNLSVLLNR